MFFIYRGSTNIFMQVIINNSIMKSVYILYSLGEITPYLLIEKLLSDFI